MQNGFAPLPSGTECYVTAVTSQGTALRANCQRLTRHAVVFEVCAPTSVLLVSELLSDFIIVLNGRTAYAGKAVVKKLVGTGLAEVCEAEVGEGWSDVELYAGLTDTGRLSTEFRHHIAAWHGYYKIRPEYKVHLADMQMFFTELRLWLDQVELGIRAAPDGDRAELERDVTSQLAATVIPLVNDLFGKFEVLAQDVEEDFKPLHRAYMKRQLHPLVLCAPFAYRTYTKPLGYPGDYEMVNMISRNGQEGGSLYAKVVNSWFLNQAPAQAHRNRLKYLGQKFTDETVRISARGRPARVFNLACGPALEVQDFLAESHLSDRMEIALIDFNQETLDHTSTILESLRRKHTRTTSLRYVKKSVQQLLKEAGKTVERPADAQYDLAYCAGLFDYLTDPVCQRLMNVMYRSLAPGGLLLVTNVHPCNPMRHGMDYLLDWNLVYRDARQAQVLRPSEAQPESLSVKSDFTGVNLFVEVRKPAHA